MVLATNTNRTVNSSRSGTTTTVGPKPLVAQGAQGNVGFVRRELRDMKAKYELIDDAVAGSIAVKHRRERYLPAPSTAGGADAQSARYQSYLTRAVFYNVAERTLNGFMGELFDKDPVVTMPPALDIVAEDANGETVGIVQLAKETARNVLKKGRAGLFVDYPNTGGTVTTAMKESGQVRPVIHMYEAAQIINWRKKQYGALLKLSLVVLYEEYDAEDDGFEMKKQKRWRVLRLNEAGFATAQIYHEKLAPGELVELRDAEGNPFDTIPFSFVGSETNNDEIDPPPLFALCDLNIAHYRNSADHEEMLYMLGQPTVVVSGLTETWADKYFSEGIPLGSRAAIPLPESASVELIEISETSAGAAAMEHKEKQMVALGAKLVEAKSVQRTATEAGMDSASEKSTLATVSDNVSLAFQWALGYCAKYEGVSEAKITFRVNKDFSVDFSNPEARAEAIAAWQAEAISFTEMRAALRKGGLATQDDEAAQAEIVEAAGAGLGPNRGEQLDENGNPINNNPDPNNVPSNQQDEI